MIFPTGDGQGRMIAEHQPVTLAAMEGLFETTAGRAHRADRPARHRQAELGQSDRGSQRAELSDLSPLGSRR